ncbi:4175_t:CDS:2 [Ambispora leptoticha]|uniref:4175_t:CDS:1 n=1 Tax=Ambispora leptoticha TaxID=144679 RepID=A0A9N9EIF8_9GLOM|nr:4175_t:CDS:2 [Ambispora leptoticha]
MYKNQITLQTPTLLSIPNSSMTDSFLPTTNASMTDSLLSASNSSTVVESIHPGECHQVTDDGKPNIVKNKISKWRKGTIAIPNVTTRKRSTRRKWAVNSGASKSLHKKAYEELNRQINFYNDQFIRKMRCVESMPIEQQSKWLRNSALLSESKKSDELDQDIEELMARMSGNSMEVDDYSVVYKYQLECVAEQEFFVGIR